MKRNTIQNSQLLSIIGVPMIISLINILAEHLFSNEVAVLVYFLSSGLPIGGFIFFHFVKKHVAKEIANNLPRSFILHICPKLTHESGKTLQLILWWHKDRLVVKDIETSGYEGLHFFPNELPQGGKSLKCPYIESVWLRSDGTGWNIQGVTAEGNEFVLVIRHDFLKDHTTCNTYASLPDF